MELLVASTPGTLGTRVGVQSRSTQRTEQHCIACLLACCLPAWESNSPCSLGLDHGPLLRANHYYGRSQKPPTKHQPKQHRPTGENRNSPQAPCPRSWRAQKTDLAKTVRSISQSGQESVKLARHGRADPFIATLASSGAGPRSNGRNGWRSIHRVEGWTAWEGQGRG